MVMLDAWRWCAETRMVLDVHVVDLVKKITVSKKLMISEEEKLTYGSRQYVWSPCCRLSVNGHSLLVVE